MKKLKILLVDDDAPFTTSASRALEETGRYELLAVSQSARAFFSARQFRPNLILLNIDMPGKHGREIAWELGQDVTLRDIPIIFLTALASPSGDSRKPSKAVGEIILTKPMEPRLLLDCVSKALPSHFKP